MKARGQNGWCDSWLLWKDVRVGVEVTLAYDADIVERAAQVLQHLDQLSVPDCRPRLHAHQRRDHLLKVGQICQHARFIMEISHLA